MNKTICAFSMAVISMLTLSSCHHDTLADKAEKEARQYTEKYCPTPYIEMQRTDSLTFDRSTNTFNFYYSLQGKADDAQLIRDNAKTLKANIKKQLHDDTKNKAYKDAGFKFRYVYRSSKTGQTLLDVTLSGK